MFEHPRVGLGVLLFNEFDHVLLGKRRGSHGEGMWSIPGGHIEFRESCENCAIREVFEETGVTIERPYFVGISEHYFEKENKHYISIFMKATLPENALILNCEPHKNEEWCWFDIKDLPKPLFPPLEKFLTGSYRIDFSQNTIDSPRLRIVNK
ncbi:MAG: ADP-ribose pyrophosphatase MutT [Pseudomonadota bacterium]|jgi:8-oxo-dGTP diphosphatase